MKFQMTMIVVSFITTVILAFIIIPILKKVKVGQIERDDGPKSHFDKQGTPTMGGIIIALRNNYWNNWWIYILFWQRTRNSR